VRIKLVIFEDDKAVNFEPLTYTRAVFELRCGGSQLYEKYLRTGKFNSLCLFVRPEISETVQGRFLSAARSATVAVNDTGALREDDLLVVNGRLLPGDDGMPIEKNRAARFTVNGETAAVFLPSGTDLTGKNGGDLAGLLTVAESTLPAEPLSGLLLEYPWDLVSNNSEEIRRDFPHMGAMGEPIKRNIPGLSIVGDPRQVLAGDDVMIDPQVVIDTRKGPVLIADKVNIAPFSRIEGPCCIGAGSHIVGANIREGCTIGPVCRIGGEVEESIIQGYSNKYHDGFLGHAYMGEWVNLGAGTTNSDLKNTYAAVKVRMGGDSAPVDTGLTKVGSFIGDHVKTSIGTYLNTGTVFGMMTNVVGTGQLCPSYIPSFTWFLKGKIRRGYGGFDRFAETARTAMSRRGCTLTEKDIALYKLVYERTEPDRIAVSGL